MPRLDKSSLCSSGGMFSSVGSRSDSGSASLMVSARTEKHTVMQIADHVSLPSFFCYAAINGVIWHRHNWRRKSAPTSYNTTKPASWRTYNMTNDVASGHRNGVEWRHAVVAVGIEVGGDCSSTPPFPFPSSFPCLFPLLCILCSARPSHFFSPLSSFPPPFVSVPISQLSISPHFRFMSTPFPHSSASRSLPRSGALNPVSRSGERCNLPSGVWGGDTAEIEFFA